MNDRIILPRSAITSDPTIQMSNIMINSLRIFEHPTSKCIREAIESYAIKGYGYVYALEVGDYVKIGCTTKPDKRFIQIKQGATGYGGVDVGRLAVSAAVNDYSLWEKRLHEKFRRLRKPGTELFSIPFGAAVRCLVRDGEKDCLCDEFEIWNSSVNTRNISSPIYKNGVASQIFVLLISLIIDGKYVFTSRTALKFLAGISDSEVEYGLAYLQDNGVIKITDCGDETLIEFHNYVRPK